VNTQRPHSDKPIALITGVTGQDGSYLTELLLSKGYEVHGVVRRSSNLTRSRIDRLRADTSLYGKSFFLHYCNLLDITTLRRICRKANPTEMYHLAGQSHVGLSFEIPESTCEEVAMSTLRLLEICRDEPPGLRIYHASTSEIFGRVDKSPQDEETPFRPTSPYGCAKAFATQIAQAYREAHGMFVCNGILYNHESPRRGENFVTRKITRRVAEIKLGFAKELALGNVRAHRDWGYAPDYVEAMWRMLQAEQAGDYVVATGVAHTVLDFVQAAFAVVGLPWDRYLVTNQSFIRAAEPRCLVGDASKIKRELGWHPTKSFSQIVREMVEADMEALAKEKSRKPE